MLLLKNVLKSFKKNKVSIIGLTFLVFLSMGMFTVLNSTTNNINSTYYTISQKGNLHDFNVNEYYNIGTAK
jgi:putative ABC transport system permease protein